MNSWEGARFNTGAYILLKLPVNPAASDHQVKDSLKNRNRRDGEDEVKRITHRFLHFLDETRLSCGGSSEK